MKKYFSILAAALCSFLSVQAEEQETTYEGDGIADKWEFRLDAGVETSVGKGFAFNNMDGGGLIEIGAGYNLTSNWYLGVVSGFYYKAGQSETIAANNTIPMLGNVTYRWNNWNKWSLFVDGRAGFLLSVKSDLKIANVTNDYEYPNASFLEITPGVCWRVRPNIDLKFSLGYGYFLTNDDEDRGDYMHSGNTVIAKVGMNVRKAPKPIVRATPIEEPVVVETPAVVEPAAEPEPTPVQVVETTTPEQRKLSERQVVIFYIKRMHNILPDKDELLMEMAEFTKTHKTSRIVLKSYADKGTGNYELNQMYSRNRMEEVKKHLIEQYGIAPEQIEASYYGDTVQPFEENDKNRCSIITVKEVE